MVGRPEDTWIGNKAMNYWWFTIVDGNFKAAGTDDLAGVVHGHAGYGIRPDREKRSRWRNTSDDLSRAIDALVRSKVHEGPAMAGIVAETEVGRTGDSTLR